jgi:hypothetical protein
MGGRGLTARILVGGAMRWQVARQTGVVASSKTTLAEWIRRHFVYLHEAGGFWGWWCLDERGEDLGVEAVRFEELPRRWPELAARMGMPGQPLPHVNGAPAKVEWTREASDLVGELCRGDIERFGYTWPA